MTTPTTSEARHLMEWCERTSNDENNGGEYWRGQLKKIVSVLGTYITIPTPPADRSQRRVVCAALRATDGRLLLGVRHYSKDMRDQVSRRLDGGSFERLHDENQGFVDQHGVYMSREEAYAVALAAGQVIYADACGEGLDGRKLYSEGIY